jgi:hypothetical protein
MGLTFFLAQLFGVSLLIVSIAMMFRRKEMLQVLHDFLNDRATLFIGALISLMVGILLILIHNIWTGDLLTIVVTLLGWVLTLRGIIWLFVPAGLLRKLVNSAKKEQTYYVITCIVFVIGIYLTFAGFMG